MPTTNEIRNAGLKGKKNSAPTAQDIKAAAFNRTQSPFVAPTASVSMTKSDAVKKGVVQGLKQAGQAGLGALKSIPAAANELSKLGQRALSKLTFGKVKPPVSSLPSKIVTPSNQDQKAGFLGGQIGQTLAFPGKSVTSGAAKVAGLAKLGKAQPLVTAGAKAAAQTIAGAGMSKVQGASDKTALKVGALSGGLSLVGSAASPFLKQSAERSMTKALGPTTKTNKELSDRVVPELIKRKTVAMTRGSLFNKAATKAEKAGEALEEGYTKLPKGATTDWKPVFENLTKAKEEITVNGVVMDVGRHRALDNLQRDLYRVVGGGAKEAKDAVVSVETARKVRQILDRTIAQKSKTFGLTGSETDKLAVQKIAANSIRSELAKNYPDIAKLNKEFNFWSNVEQVVGDTIRRTKGQSPIGVDLATDTGAILGGMRGGTISDIATNAFLLRTLKQVLTSTAWRTTSAITKASLANFLSRGDVAKATTLLQRISATKQNK